jgi:hypothetical protein
MRAYRKAWDERVVDAKQSPMDFEDFFDEDPDAILGAKDEMLENDLIRKAFV